MRPLSRVLRDANALTVEAWVTSRDASLVESYPARIVTLSINQNKRNFTLGQTRDARYDVRLRTSATNPTVWAGR